MATSRFTPRRRSPSQHISVTVNDATLRGKAIARDTTDGAVGVLATSSATVGAIGFLFREVTATGPDVVQRTQIWGSDPMVAELEQPDKAGDQCTVEVLEKFEAEGPEYVLDSGTGAIDANTALGSKIAWYVGKARVLQGSELDQGYRLIQHLTPEDGDNATAIVVEKVI